MASIASRTFTFLLAAFISLGAIWTSYPVHAQSTIAKQKKELQRLRNSIQQTQSKIDLLTKEEKKTKRSLSAYQHQRHEIAVFIAELENQLTQLRDSASSLQSQIEQTKASLNAVQHAYDEVSVNMIKQKAKYKGIPDATLKKDTYYSQLSAELALYKREMLALQDSLSFQQDLLTDYASTQQNLLSTKSTEQKRLSTTISKSSGELTRLRSDKTQLAKELHEKQQSALKLRSLIDRLVADEQRKAAERRAAEHKRTAHQHEPIIPEPSAGKVVGFPAKSLPWPTRSHSVMQGYGTYTNRETGTILENPGIDIGTKNGSEVVSVANGDVSSITFLPGFGSLVIVDHGNGVRTVYANLSGVSVTKGAHVSAGTRIGSSGENIDGELLHFELWNGKSRQNPLTYLR